MKTASKCTQHTCAPVEGVSQSPISNSFVRSITEFKSSDPQDQVSNFSPGNADQNPGLRLIALEFIVVFELLTPKLFEADTMLPIPSNAADVVKMLIQ